MSASKQIVLENLKNLLHGHADTAQEFLVREEQINRRDGINLDADGVFRIADRGSDTQILLDFPEESFDLPAVFVDVGDGFGRRPKMVSQKFVMLAAFRVTIADTA